MSDQTAPASGQQSEVPSWSEADSRVFLQLSAIAVPMREEQVATLCGLIPATPAEQFTVAELGAGDGTLARSVLAAFPHCHYLALERSDALREALLASLGADAARVEARPFELANGEWRASLPHGLRCVLSSLVVHHLDGDAKHELFRGVAERLEPGGALLLADIVEPQSAHVRAVLARQWDADARARSLARTGDLSIYDEFRARDWNYFTETTPDSIDHPSPLFDQLLWLREAGFRLVDCFWMHAGHAIYGGYR